MRSLLIALLLGAAACASRQASPTADARAAEQPPRGIAFVENDLPGALAQAQAEGKPLFVDAWAPW